MKVPHSLGDLDKVVSKNVALQLIESKVEKNPDHRTIKVELFLSCKIFV